MTIVSEHFISAELADWQTPVKDKDLTTSPESPSNGDRYIIAGIGGDWSAGTINDIVWYINSAWYFITPVEGMQVYLEDENLYYFYNGSAWGTISGDSSLWEVDGTETQLKTADEIDMQTKKIINVVDPTSDQDVATKKYVDDNTENIIKNSNNIIINAFRIAVNGALDIFNMIDLIVDEYEDETGIDTVNSNNETYDSDGDFYKPTPGGSISVSPYAHFKCNDDAENTTVTDDGTGSNNGTSSTNTSNLSVTGKINEAFDFTPASSEYINIDNLWTDIASDTSGTIAVWVYPDASGRLMMFGDTNGNDMFIIYWSSTGGGTWSIEVYVDDAFKWAMSIAGYPGGSWSHIALVQNGTSPKFYINGSDVTNLTNTTDTTWWFNDYTTLDNGRLGCENWYSQGNLYFWDGKIDDFRYYQSALSSADIVKLYNSGTGTEDDKPTGDTQDMTLISDTFVAESAPDKARIVILEEDVDSITLNTDIKAYISEDDGSNWHQATLVDEGDYDADKRLLIASVVLTDESDTDMVYKIESLNNKGLKIHATSLSWD